ncbi:thymidine phosphorylase [Xinfangfangia sp. D13-10-4-6]|uniref:thymidine phosphorylase n=1 Tax=Pseudogemmobacter hezensis TaxID=2737662 RepID=UPI001556D0F4|nr:thymidine phosphorylase [Pseudogemmobacter hezensis]NPD14584.1 thymidine phosphorylase [Pseudogemmobacter hezensis]
MQAARIIATIRDGATPPPEALRWFAMGLASGEVSDAQAGAFAMAVLLRGLSDEGRVALTLGMRDSGRRLTWTLPGPVVDKHSTGGIGDCISLLLAPALAACGAYVPMISGRGLGFTGGTLDKLEAIPGYRTALPEAEFRLQLQQCGCAIVAATEALAPADRRLYAIRDVTGTVESLDLITASILSKKLAAGPEALVLDVKCGSGAFMKQPEQAEALAQALVSVAQGAGCAARALITDMSQPLATAAGNALEVIEVMETLTGSAVNADLRLLTGELGGEALALAGLAGDTSEGMQMILAALDTGRAAEVFGRMVAAQGGPADFVERWPDRLPAAPVVIEVTAPEGAAGGIITAIDGEALGHAVVALGGGRRHEGDRINPGVGLSDLAGLGDEVANGAALALVHAADTASAERAVAAVQQAYRIGTDITAETTPGDGPLVLKRIG